MYKYAPRETCSRFGNSLHSESTPTSSVEQALLALLLIMGLYFPTSTHGEHSTLCIVAAVAVLLSLLCSLLWRLGPIPGTATYIALPLLIILLICSLRALVGGALQFDMGICAKFMGLALLLTLNLRRVGIGRVVETLFVLANVVNIAFGIAILIGTDWVTDFLPKFYWSFYPDLIPNMVKLHKPVLTLGTHASASLFLYLFFCACPYVDSGDRWRPAIPSDRRAGRRRWSGPGIAGPGGGTSRLNLWRRISGVESHGFPAVPRSVATIPAGGRPRREP